MGFGAVGSMNVVLKNNKKLLSKRDKLKSLGAISDDKKEKDMFNFPESNPKKVQAYKQRFLLEKKQRQLVRVLLYFLVLAISVSFYIYLSSLK